MNFNPELRSRIRFAWVIAWDILLPTLTVGIAAFTAVLEGLSLVTGREVYPHGSIFWIRIFSIAFGMMAVVRKNFAILETRRVCMSGFVTWMVGAFVHMVSLPGVRNRMRVQTQRLWSYLTGQGRSLQISEVPTATSDRSVEKSPGGQAIDV